MVKKEILIRISCIFALISSISVTSVYAYSKFGGKWSSSSIKYAIDAPTSYVAPIEDAAKMWTNNTNVTLTRNNSSDINVYADYYGNVSWNGTSRMNGGTDFSGKYSYGYIMINQTYVDKYTNLQEKLIVAHEFGHELGLAHNMKNNAVLMYGTSAGGDVFTAYSNNSSLATKPASDDINGVNSIY